MKPTIKQIIASMSVLGLVSCPIYAIADTDAQQKSKNQKVYKGQSELPSLEVCPAVNMYTILMDAMSQNTGRAKPTVGCDKPIQIAGGINFDTTWGNRSMGYQGEVNDRFALNDAYINFTGNVNEWVKAFIELSYTSMSDEPLSHAAIEENPLAFVDKPKPGIYSSSYTLGRLDLQQGFITIGNPEQYPLFLRLGKQFLDFGRYTIHPITRSFTQVMTESLQTAADISFISAYNGMGLHGSLFAFQNPMTEENDEHGKTNYGGQLGLSTISDQLGWDIGVGYLNNITGVNDVAYAVTLFNEGSLDGDGSYDDRVGAATIYGSINSGPFSFAIHYATALKHFNADDLTTSVEDEDEEDDSEDGAKPWAADATAGYGFNAFDHSQNIYISYQVSEHAVNLYLPKNRWMVGYGIDVLKNTNATFELSHDKDYGRSVGGTGEGSTRGVVRVGVKFG